MEDFKDKVAFITGGASGVGLGQAKVLAGLGVKVVLADIRQDHLDQALAWFRERAAPAHGIRLGAPLSTGRGFSCSMAWS